MILGRTSDASDEVFDEAEVVCSVRIVVLCAMQAYSSGVGCEEDDAILALVQIRMGAKGEMLDYQTLEECDCDLFKLSMDV